MKGPYLTVSYEWIKEHLRELAYTPHPDVACGALRLPNAREVARYTGDTCLCISEGCRMDLTGDITLGLWTMIGSGVMLYTHEHDHGGHEPLILREERGELEFTKVYPKVIGEDVWIHSSRILAKCDEIADGVVIGAGSVVTRPIHEAYTIWCGVPARKIGKR